MQHFSGHASGEAVVAVTVTFTVLAFLATAARLFSRIHLFHSAGADDVLIAFASITSILLTVCMCMQVKYGMGQHVYTLNLIEIEHALMWFWVSILIYCLAMTFAKLSILLQYLRLFPNKRFRLGCFILIGFNIVWPIVAFFVAVFECRPIRAFWDFSVQGKCFDRLPIWYTDAALSIFVDICIVILPLPVLKSLQLPKRQKYVLMGVFAMGGVVCIISILRLPSLYVISVATDISWENPLAAIWSCMEVNVAILCSCIPTLRGVVSRYFPDVLSHVTGGSDQAHTPVAKSDGPSTGDEKASRQISAASGKADSSGSRRSRFGSSFNDLDEKDMEEGDHHGVSKAVGSSPTTEPPSIQVTTIAEHESGGR